MSEIQVRARAPRAPVIPVEDNRCGSPPYQLRVQLARAKAAGLPFEDAWKVAFRRVKWPHNTRSRVEWKVMQLTLKPLWRACYEDTLVAAPGVNAQVLEAA